MNVAQWLAQATPYRQTDLDLEGFGDDATTSVEALYSTPDGRSIRVRASCPTQSRSAWLLTARWFDAEGELTESGRQRPGELIAKTEIPDPDLLVFDPRGGSRPRDLPADYDSSSSWRRMAPDSSDPNDLGPEADRVRTLMEDAKYLSRAQIERLAQAFNGFGRGYDEAASVGLSKRKRGWDRARRCAPGGMPQDARLAIMNAASALVVRDLISPRAFDEMYGPWASAIDAHPDESSELPDEPAAPPTRWSDYTGSDQPAWKRRIPDDPYVRFTGVAPEQKYPWTSKTMERVGMCWYCGDDVWDDRNVAFLCRLVSLDASYRNVGRVHPGCASLDPFNWLPQANRMVLEGYYGLTPESRRPSSPVHLEVDGLYRSFSLRDAVQIVVAQLINAAVANDYSVPDDGEAEPSAVASWVQRLWRQRPLATWYEAWRSGAEAPPRDAA